MLDGEDDDFLRRLIDLVIDQIGIFARDQLTHPFNRKQGPITTGVSGCAKVFDGSAEALAKAEQASHNARPRGDGVDGPLRHQFVPE
jgi:hypothetical protein